MLFLMPVIDLTLSLSLQLQIKMRIDGVVMAKLDVMSGCGFGFLVGACVGVASDSGFETLELGVEEVDSVGWVGCSTCPCVAASEGMRIH